MRMLQRFLLIVLLVGSCRGLGYCPTYEDDYNPPSKQRDPVFTKFTTPKCNIQGSGGTNWFGVMAGMASVVPGGGFLAGMLTIFSSVDFGSDFMDDLNECIEHMIGLALEESDLKKSINRLEQIQYYKGEFLGRLELTMDETTLKHAYADISQMTTNLGLIQVDFAQHGDGHTDERHHEKFLDLYLEAVAIELSAKVLLLSHLSVQNYHAVCSEATNIRLDLDSRWDQCFGDDGSSFHMQKVLDESQFNEWPSKISFTIDETFGVQELAVMDEYRGFVCESCCIPPNYLPPPANKAYCCRSSLYFDNYPAACSGHDHVQDCNHPGHSLDAHTNCRYCTTFARNQVQAAKISIDHGSKMVKNLRDAIESIENQNNCGSPQTTAKPTTPARHCAWVRGDSCYNYDMKAVSWPDAEDFCKDNYEGHLVAPSTEDEMMFLEGKLNELVENEPDLRKRFWIGAKLDDHEHWFWGNGESWEWDYHAPDGEEGGRDRLYLYGSDDGEWRWHSNEYHEKYPIMCESK